MMEITLHSVVSVEAGPSTHKDPNGLSCHVRYLTIQTSDGRELKIMLLAGRPIDITDTEK